MRCNENLASAGFSASGAAFFVGARPTGEVVYFYNKLGVKPTHILGLNGGINNEIVSHAWLEIDQLVIDITADQFNDEGYHFGGVYVGERTNWYGTFDIKVDLYDKDLSDVLIRVYDRICREL